MPQGPTSLPTSGVFSGLAEQTAINAALLALLTNNSGAAPPTSNVQQYQFWADTSGSGQVTLRIFVGMTWTPLFAIDLSTGMVAELPGLVSDWVAASGTHDAIVADYDPAASALVDGMTSNFRATAANLTTAPTFDRDGLGALVVTKKGGHPLAIGDIPGNLAEVELRLNTGGNCWELINPPAVPIGGLVPYFGGAVPWDFALPQGQNLAASTYSALNVVLGTTYGNPGSGMVTLPDLRGRFIFSLDAGGSGRITSAGGNFDGTVLGGAGGAQNRTIAQNQLPNIAPSFSGTAQTWTLNNNAGAQVWSGLTGLTVPPGPGPGVPAAVNFLPQGPTNANQTVAVTPAGTNSSINGGVTQQATPTLPPAIGVNCMMRVL